MPALYQVPHSTLGKNWQRVPSYESGSVFLTWVIFTAFAGLSASLVSPGFDLSGQVAIWMISGAGLGTLFFGLYRFDFYNMVAVLSVFVGALAALTGWVFGDMTLVVGALTIVSTNICASTSIGVYLALSVRMGHKSVKF